MLAEFVRRNKFRIAVSAATYAAYGVLIAVAPPQLHHNLVIFSFFPAIAVAASFGLNAGLVNGVFLIVCVNSLAFVRLGEDPLVNGLTIGNIAGILCTLAMVFIVGTMHNLRMRLRISLDAIEATRAALAESEAGFRSMFEGTSEGVVLISPRTGRFIAANPSVCDMFGYTEEELFLLTTEDVCPPELKEGMRAAMRRLFDGQSVPEHEGISLTKTGAKINVIISNRTLKWKGETAFHVTFKNITYLKEIQRRLEEKNQEILHVTNMITHDLRNPLAGIKATLDMLQETPALRADTDALEIVGLGREAARYMEGLISDLLDLARLESGAKSLELRTVDLREIVDSAVSRLKTQARAKNVAVDVALDGVVVVADPAELVKVYMNLIGNAIAYIGDTHEPRITIGMTGSGGAPTFFVKDNGMGIPAESLPTIFDKFKRGSNVYAIKGTGLGLAIVKGIVEAHGGEVRVESEVGKGTTFFFSLAAGA